MNISKEWLLKGAAKGDEGAISVAGRPHDWIWVEIAGTNACRRCGLIQRSDGDNRPCRGNVPVKMR